MAESNSYCAFCKAQDDTNVHKVYHDTKYGFPIEDDNELFGRLILEINQAGLSWETILKKEDNFYKAYNQFDINKVAAYTEDDRQRLLSDAGIIRNKLKVNAAIHNANQIIALKEEHGSFKAWLDKNHPKAREEWVKLFKKVFKFTGGEITNEFFMSTGYLKGAHDDTCEVQVRIKAIGVKWME